jgi:hypothetical protein
VTAGFDPWQRRYTRHVNCGGSLAGGRRAGRPWLGLAAALLVSATSGCVDLGTQESPEAVPQPNWAQYTPYFWEYFGSGFGRPDQESERKTSVAFGGGRVYVASETNDRVTMFDAKTFAPQGSFGGPGSGRAQLSNPVGVAYYRDEVFVADPGNLRIVVYDRDGNYKREFVGDYAGIDVAWGEVWAVAGDRLSLGELFDSYVSSPQNPCSPDYPYNDGEQTYSDDEPAGRTHGGGTGLGGTVLVLDAQTGAPKGALLHAPHEAGGNPIFTDAWFRLGKEDDCGGFGYWKSWEDPGGWWDIAVAPEISAVAGGYRMINRTPLLTGVYADDLLGSCECDDDAKMQDGTDAAWGMRWFLAVSGDPPQEYDFGKLARGSRISEYSIETDATTGAKRLVRRRQWSPRQAGEGSVRDVGYQNREATINWRGKLASHNDWLNGSQSMEFVVSDADIALTGNQGEHWLEPARNFDHLELRIDGQSYSFSVDGAPEATTSTDPAGFLDLDLERVPSGKHVLELIGHLTNGTRVVATNPNLWVDHTVPKGTLDPLGYAVRGTVTLNGTLADEHKGPKDWRPQVTRSQQGSWGEICAVAAPGPYRCVWDTTRHPDGWHDLRAGLDDLMVDRHHNPTTTPVASTIVDNNAPTFGLSGSLVDAGNFPLEYGQPESLSVDARDGAGSGVASIEVQVDGVQRQLQSFGCTSGGCARSSGFTFRPEQYGEGVHTIDVIVRDHVGFETRQSLQRDVESPPPDVPDTTTSATATSAATPPGGLAQSIAPSDATELVTGTTDELLRCTGVEQDLNFVAYSLGSSFEGLPVTALLRDCELPYPGEPGRANHVTYVYGDCVLPTPADGGCAPPLEVQTWPACERSLADYYDPAFPDAYSRTTARGVPAASFDGGTRFELYAGGSTIVIFGADPAQVRRAADAVVADPDGRPPTVPATNPTAEELARPLPEPLPGATIGALSCLAQLEGA